MSNQVKFSVEYGTPMSYLKQANRVNAPKKVPKITGDATNSN
jgi:LysM repeat protein